MTMTQVVDLSFRLLGQDSIPADHGYALYGALSRLAPALHTHNAIGVHPIRGQQAGNRTVSLTDRSRLVFRVQADHVPQLLPLSGKSITLGASRIRIGVPEIRPLVPATALRSRLVIIKAKDALNAADLTEAVFTASARRQLDALEISAESVLTLRKRRTLRIKDKEIVGYEVILEGLLTEESLNIQGKGLGGRRHMGCGVFVALG